jgi:hypothetical protein
MFAPRTGEGATSVDDRAFSIEKCFREILCDARSSDAGPPRAPFADPVLVSFRGVSLSKRIDSEYERQNNASSNGATRILKRVLGKLRGD